MEFRGLECFSSSSSVSLSTLIPYECPLLRWTKYECVPLDCVFRTAEVVYSIGLLMDICGVLEISKVSSHHMRLSHSLTDAWSAISEDLGAFEIPFLPNTVAKLFLLCKAQGALLLF